ncbi:MAG TPA: glycosyltransferase [Patescibacteria group bacterium]|nr:glycosyltransferase [Patescibacteria group bacterium]
MNSESRHQDASYHLFWVCGENLNIKLHAARWLETGHELTQLGWQVTLVAAGPTGQSNIGGVNVIYIAKPQIYLLRQIVSHIHLLFLIAQHWPTIDVVLFESMSAPWLLPLRLIRSMIGRRRPLLVMDTRSLSMTPLTKESRKDWARKNILTLNEHLGHRWADGCTAITPRLAESLHIPKEKLLGIWPSGVTPDKFASAQVARSWPLPGEPIHLVYVGVLNYERNLMTFCQAVEKANAEGMAFHFFIVGDGTERADLEQFAKQTAGRICIGRPVPHAQVPQILARYHIGVLPFPDEEKFQVSSPIKLFEYMAAGLPILATRIACHIDVIGEGKFVFWAEQADLAGLLAALRLVWLNRDSLSEMGAQAAVAAQAWTWNESAKKLKLALEYGLARV